MSAVWVITVAAIAGVAITVQGQLMGIMDRGLGTMESVFITYAVGGVLAALLLLLFRGGNLGQWQQLPWWVLSSGIVGLVIVSGIGYSVGQLGAVGAFTVIVAVQFFVATLIDHFGLFGAPVREIGLRKLTGIGTLMLGVWLTLR
ncbi:DMT family transporter [Motiliproteus sediminis]|uniref:DMT family transporter n=1 Tax=Motiliproteus sediminis TaxID=1468178 RepID=UPI001AEFAB2B|nr:DMT family transporter [Motiliproteus sediminis]